MPNYRIYLMSGDLVRSAYDFKCETDAYALTQAQSMLGEHSKKPKYGLVRQKSVAWFWISLL